MAALAGQAPWNDLLGSCRVLLAAAQEKINTRAKTGRRSKWPGRPPVYANDQVRPALVRTSGAPARRSQVAKTGISGDGPAQARRRVLVQLLKFAAYCAPNWARRPFARPVISPSCSGPKAGEW
jgi:hypothetical protein